jgi:uncharacterized protein
MRRFAAGMRNIPMKISWKRVVRKTAVVVSALVVLHIGALYFLQPRLIYFPRHYRAEFVRPQKLVELNYDTNQGRQCSFYIPPEKPSGPAPERLWVLFGGNGSLALDWKNLIRQSGSVRDGWLLVEYPGYGNCEGKPSPATILDGSEKAYATLAAHLGVEPDALNRDLNVLGHSLGCAAALQFAARHPVKRAVLVSPFTNMRDMGRRMVGWPLCLLCEHNFDNRARLAELAARANPPRVDIFHGTSDHTIPFWMGQSLAGAFPKMIAFHAVRSADHEVVVTAAAEILAVMQERM